MEDHDVLEEELERFLRKRKRSKILTASFLILMVVLILGGIAAKTFIKVDKRKKIFMRALDAGNLGVVERIKELGVEILPELYERLDHQDPQVRACAGLSIMKFPENIELERLYPLLEDESENVRAFIIQEATLQLEIPTLNALLVKALESENAMVVRQALGLLREKVSGAPTDTNPVLQKIEELANSGEKQSRYEAIACLWYWNIEGAIDLMEKEYKNGKEDDKIFFLSLIRKRPREAATDLVSKEMRSRDMKIRAEALFTAAELRIPSAFPIFARALRKVKDSPEDYASFLRAMAKIDAKRGVPYFRKALESEDPDVYSAGKEGLMAAGIR